MTRWKILEDEFLDQDGKKIDIRIPGIEFFESYLVQQYHTTSRELLHRAWATLRNTGDDVAISFAIEHWKQGRYLDSFSSDEHKVDACTIIEAWSGPDPTPADPSVECALMLTAYEKYVKVNWHGKRITERQSIYQYK